MKTGKHHLSHPFVFILTLIVLCQGQNFSYAQDAAEETVFEKVHWQQGPSIADLDNWAEIRVPAGYVFANSSDTQLLMEAMGNPSSSAEVGFFAPDTLEWFIVFEFDEVGYVRDDEKDTLDSDTMLESIRRGTEESNELRRQKGFPGLNIIGWEIKPRYNEKTHNLEWAFRAEGDNGELVLNHNTRLLGRKGVMRATLVLAPQSFSEVFPIYSERL